MTKSTEPASSVNRTNSINEREGNGSRLSSDATYNTLFI